MKCKVLTDDRWRRFLEDKLSEEESREIDAHLGTDCSECEEFFSALDGATERELRHTYNRLVNLDNAKIKKSVDVRKLVHSFYAEGPAGDPERTASWSTRAGAIWGFGQDTLALTGGVLAILVIAVGGLPFLSDVDLPVQREKGLVSAESVGSNIGLDFMIGERLPDGKLEISRGMNGASYRSGELLMLRYNVERSGYVYLVQSRGDKIDVLYPLHNTISGPVSAGEHQINDGDGRLLAFPLDQSGGRNIIISVFSPIPLVAPNDVISIVVKAIDPSGKVNKQKIQSLGKGVSADVVYFNVGA